MKRGDVAEADDEEADLAERLFIVRGFAERLFFCCQARIDFSTTDS
jgi:hypothetical protein